MPRFQAVLYHLDVMFLKLIKISFSKKKPTKGYGKQISSSSILVVAAELFPSIPTIGQKRRQNLWSCKQLRVTI